MLKKRKYAKENVVRVTFELPPGLSAREVHVSGDFNEWSDAHPLKQQKDGSWKTTIPLEPDREYQFRYQVDRTRWMNDPAADDYVYNPYGEENSVVRT